MDKKEGKELELRENSMSSNFPYTNHKASLRIMGECFDVHKITEVLEVCPDETWNKGDFIRNTGKKRTYTAWIYNTELLESPDLNMSVKQIMEVFGEKADKIILLKNEFDLEISLDFVIVIEDKEPPAIYFDVDFINFASKIGARIDIDTYVN